MKKKLSTEEIENEIKSETSPQFLHELGEPVEEAFEYIKRVMEERDIKASDIVNQCSGEKSYIYQMLNGKRKTTRKFLISFGLIAGLSVEEQQKLLMLAGRSPLYVKKRYDAAVYYALEHSMGIKELNELLYELGEEIL